MTAILTTTDHSRASAGLKYVYPVISRRAGGLSIGINVNTNNACNWRCVYCQVPNLTLGKAPDMDFDLLATELREFLNDVLTGDFYDRFHIDTSQRVIKDIAISGNGEPTSVKNFAKTVALIGDMATDRGVLPDSQYVLITNGSLIHLPSVQQGLRILQNYNGEVWFKFDSATQEGRRRINHCAQTWQTSLKNLALSAKLCRTKLQICLFEYQNIGFVDAEQEALLRLLETVKRDIPVQDIMLYTLARTSLQPEADQLKKLSFAELNSFADKIRILGFNVSISI